LALKGLSADALRFGAGECRSEGGFAPSADTLRTTDTLRAGLRGSQGGGSGQFELDGCSLDAGLAFGRVARLPLSPCFIEAALSTPGEDIIVGERTTVALHLPPDGGVGGPEFEQSLFEGAHGISFRYFMSPSSS
jgi:hypothetical protein